jgi:CheY-like chemotaxis protein
LIATKTILYIEDDPASRLLVERALKHAGYHVLVAERGLDGIDMARRESPDLILTDIKDMGNTGRWQWPPGSPAI